MRIALIAALAALTLATIPDAAQATGPLRAIGRPLHALGNRLACATHHRHCHRRG
jgi:hypothetical protein